MSTPRSLSQAIALNPRLNSTDRLVALVLDQTRRDLTECWLASRTIADRIGRKVRTVQLALQKLQEESFIVVRRDHKLNSRHRITLAWRGQWAPAPDPSISPDFGAADCAERAQRIAPRISPPLEPPYKEPEGEETRESDGGTVSPPPQEFLNSPEKTQQVEPIAPAVTKAEKVFGADPSTPGRIGWFVKRFGMTSVLRGLDQCQAKAKRGAVVGYGYLRGTLEGYQADGGPPPNPADREREREAAEREIWRSIGFAMEDD